jgi:hypothetical protein
MVHKVWVVFKLNMTYDDSGYEIHEKSLLHKLYFTEESAQRELNIVKQEELKFIYTSYISGYKKEYYPNLVNKYCYIEEIEVYA